MIKRRTAVVGSVVGALIGTDVTAQEREKPTVVNAHHTK
jgi:hypothetical protein